MRILTGFQHGINLGGWLSQCVHTKEHYDSFISESDVAVIASWGLDHIRLPIDYNLVQREDGSFIEEGFGYIDSCVKWCENSGLNLVLDLHKAIGYFFDDPSESNTFFRSEKLQELFYALWEKMAVRYGKKSHVAFELLNEIVDLDLAETWNAVAAEAVRRIRVHAPDSPIIIGGVNSNSVSTIHGLDAPADSNIVYNFHFYEPLIFTHQSAHWIPDMPRDFVISYPCSTEEALRHSWMYIPAEKNAVYDGYTAPELNGVFFDTLIARAAAIAEERNVPLYCGEYGVIDLADPQHTLNWYSDINRAFVRHGIGRAAWTYKAMDFGLTDSHYDDVREQLIKLL